MSHQQSIVEFGLSKLLEIDDRDEDYVRLGRPTGLNPCPLCDSPAELWQRKHEDQYHKVVVCPNNGKQDPEFQCALYFPPECFYHATKREAVEYWQKHTKRDVPLTFASLRYANATRQKEFPGTHAGWIPAQWFQAMTGEFGEYANVRKKFERGDLLKEDFLERAGEELADIMVYLDILAVEVGVDLEAAIVRKFNADSTKRKCVTMLPAKQLAVVDHAWRFSDDANYDAVCDLCGATDAIGDKRANQACTGAKNAVSVS